MRSAVLRAGLAALAVSSTAAGGSGSAGLGVDRGGRQLLNRARGVLRPRRAAAMVGAPGGDDDATMRGASAAGAASTRPAAAGVATASSATMAQSTAQTISPGGSTATFPPIFVVNLDRNPERWQKVLGECEREGVAAQRLPAVNGKALSQEEVEAGSTWLCRNFSPRGVIGCFMSHQSFWASVIERGDEVAIVLEDDAYLEPGFAANCQARIDELTAHDPDWDVCLLGAMGCAHPKGEHGFNVLFAQYMRGMRRRREISEGIYVPRRPAGTHAYAVSAKGARALARMCPKAAFHIDLHAWSSAHRDLRLYACHPFLAYQTFTDSTIGGDKPGRSEGLGLIDEHCRQPWSHALNEPMFKLGSFIMTPAKHQAIMCAAAASIVYTRSPVVAGGAASLLGSCWALVQCMNRPVSVREPAGVPAASYAAALPAEVSSTGAPPQAAAEFAMPPSPPPPQPAAA